MHLRLAQSEEEIRETLAVSYILSSYLFKGLPSLKQVTKGKYASSTSKLLKGAAHCDLQQENMLNNINKPIIKKTHQKTAPYCRLVDPTPDECQQGLIMRLIFLKT